MRTEQQGGGNTEDAWGESERGSRTQVMGEKFDTIMGFHVIGFQVVTEIEGPG